MGGLVSRVKQSSADDAHRKGSRGIPCRRPACASIQAHAFIRHYLEHATASKRLGVGLTLDFEDIQGQKDNLPDPNDATGFQSELHPRTT